MINWAFELLEFETKYQARVSLRAQVLVDFLAEMTLTIQIEPENLQWTIHVDESSNSKGSGAGLIVEQSGHMRREFLNYC